MKSPQEKQPEPHLSGYALLERGNNQLVRMPRETNPKHYLLNWIHPPVLPPELGSWTRAFDEVSRIDKSLDIL
jgi:hypothetical protein